MYPSQISQMTKFPFPPCPWPGWPGFMLELEEDGVEEEAFLTPGLFLPGRGVMEILGEFPLLLLFFVPKLCNKQFDFIQGIK